MHASIRWPLVAVTLSLLVACGDDDNGDDNEPPPEVDCPSEVPTFEEVSAFSDVCSNCHSTSRSGDERRGAPKGVDFDSYESARDHAIEAATKVYWGEMPPQGAGYTLELGQEDELFAWALCGTPK